MRILDLALKDLSQIFRDKKSLLFLLVMPIVFTFVMGLTFKTVPANNTDNRLPVGWITQDSAGALSQQLNQQLTLSDSIRLVEVKEDPNLMVQSGNLAAVIIIPSDFSAKALEGKPVNLEMICDELSTTGQSAVQLLQVEVTRLMSSVQIAKLDVNALEARRSFTSPTDKNAELLTAFSQASKAWDESARKSIQIIIQKATGQENQGSTLGNNPYNQSSPGMLVMFAIFGLVTSANIFVQERKSRTLQRLITTNLHPWKIIAGHLLAMFILVFVQQFLLIAFGQIFLGVEYLRQPMSILLVVVAMGLWVSSLGLFIGVFAKEEQQVIMYSMIAMFLFTALGGAWFPLETTGQTFAMIGHLTPAAWAMDGFQNILLRGLGLNSILLPITILLVYALGFFTLAVWQFRKQK